MSLAHLSKTLFLILLASSVLLSGCRSSVFVRPPALRQDISHDQLVQRFEGIAFFNEFTSDETGLRKRSAPVTWRLETSGGKDAKTSVVRILYQLAKLTGLTFTEAQPPERPSLEILIKPRAELIEHLIKAGSTHQGYIYDTLC